MGSSPVTSPNGVVAEHDFVLADDPNGFALDGGRVLPRVNVRYETYGTLNNDRTNAILVLHAFSGDAHAAGLHSPDDPVPGWWELMIGPGRALDTDRYFVIASNVLGGCSGTTGPGSIDPETGRRYAMRFPFVTISDMVRIQRALVQHLGIDRLFAVVGGSMGGMQALEWSVRYPDATDRVVLLATTTQLSAQAIAFNEVGRNAIISDPAWNDGDYYDGPQPAGGLAIARMIGHITYLSSESMRMKFGRRLQRGGTLAFDSNDQFAVESYLAHQGEKFVDRFDANSYIYLSRAMDYFDLSVRYPRLEDAFVSSRAAFLVLSYSSDWLFTTAQSKEIVYALARAGRDVSFTEINSPYGHDAFLLEHELQSELVARFLASPRDIQRTE